jgi:hypothetical protein
MSNNMHHFNNTPSTKTFEQKYTLSVTKTGGFFKAMCIPTDGYLGGGKKFNISETTIVGPQSTN